MCLKIIIRENLLVFEIARVEDADVEKFLFSVCSIYFNFIERTRLTNGNGTLRLLHGI